MMPTDEMRRLIALLEQHDDHEDEPDIFAANRRKKYADLLHRSLITKLGPVSKITLGRAQDTYSRPITSDIYVWFDYFHVKSFKTWPIDRLLISVAYDGAPPSMHDVTADIYLKVTEHVTPAGKSSAAEVSTWLESVTSIPHFEVDGDIGAVVASRRLLVNVQGRAKTEYLNFAKQVRDPSNAEFISWNRQGRSVIYNKDDL